MGTSSLNAFLSMVKECLAETRWLFLSTKAGREVEEASLRPARLSLMHYHKRLHLFLFSHVLNRGVYGSLFPGLVKELTVDKALQRYLVIHPSITEV